MEPTWAARMTSLRARLGLLAMVFLALVLIAVGMSTLMLRSWDRTVDRRAEVRQMARDVAALRLGYTDQESGIRGFQLGGDPRFLDPFDDGQAVAAAALERLRAHDVDVSGFDEQLRRAMEAAEQWRSQVAQPIVEGATSQPSEDFARLRFETLRGELDELDRMTADELLRLDDDVWRLRRNVFGVLFASAITAIAGTALAAMLFRRWVIQPLHQVGTAARALAKDDTYPLPTFESPELQDVSDAVGALQRALKTARDDAIAAFRGLEQSAVLALQVRTQLADEIGQMPPGWTADTMLVPAEGVVAGDCFDVGLLDATRLYLVVIDVTGHGAASALDALKAKSQLRAAIRSRLEPGPAIEWLSREMLKDEYTDLLTATVAVIDLSSGVIRYANAGHPPALLTNGVDVEQLEPTGPLVGAFAATWKTGRAELAPGWTLVVHTDGLTDTIGPERERFGDDRLRACLDDPEPHALLTCIRAAVDEFRVGPRSDDCTAIAIHRLADDEVETPADRPSADAVPPDVTAAHDAVAGPAGEERRDTVQP